MVSGDEREIKDLLESLDVYELKRLRLSWLVLSGRIVQHRHLGAQLQRWAKISAYVQN